MQEYCHNVCKQCVYIKHFEMSRAIFKLGEITLDCFFHDQYRFKVASLLKGKNPNKNHSCVPF